MMNDIRLRALAVAGSAAAGRASPHNHAQTARNLRHSLRNAAAGARLVQAETGQQNRLPTLQPLSQMPSKSFTGSIVASIGLPGAIRVAGKGQARLNMAMGVGGDRWRVCFAYRGVAGVS
jgi:hypothetical protein